MIVDPLVVSIPYVPFRVPTQLSTRNPVRYVDLSPNGDISHLGFAKTNPFFRRRLVDSAIAQLRWDGYIASREAMGSLLSNEWWNINPESKFIYTVQFTWSKPGKLPDPDNRAASLKHLVDGIALAISINDSRMTLADSVEIVRVPKNQSAEGTVLTLQEVP